MSFLSSLWARFVGSGTTNTATPPRFFVYIRIPESILPIERGSKYEDPLQAALEAAQLGEVSGGGSLLGAPAADGSRSVASCGIDIDLVELEPGLDLLRARLPALGALPGTQLEYTLGDQKALDALRSDGWRIGLPRTDLHPGFGV